MLSERARARNLAVGDVADQQVPERVFASRRRPTSARALDELLALELEEQLLRLARRRRRRRRARRARRPCRGRPRPAAAASPRSPSPSSRAAMIPWTVSGSSESVARARAASARTARRTAGCRPREPEAPVASRPASTGCSSRARDQARRLLVRERRERDRQGVRLAAAPARAPLEQLRPRGAEDEERHAASPSPRAGRRSRAAPSSAQWRSSKTSTSGPLLGERLEEPPPGGERLLRRSPPALARAEPASGRRWPLEPVRAPRRRRHRVDRARAASPRPPPACRSRGSRPAP